MEEEGAAGQGAAGEGSRRGCQERGKGGRPGVVAEPWRVRSVGGLVCRCVTDAAV